MTRGAVYRPRLPAARLAAVAVVALLAGCARKHPPLVDVGLGGPAGAPATCPSVDQPICAQPAPAQIRSEVDEVMDYYLSFRTKSGSSAKEALETARKDFDANGNETSRLKLALIYWAPNSPFRNDAQVAQLLEPYIRGEGGNARELRSLAHILMGSLELNRRSDSAVQAQVSRLREEQKKSEELQRKLDALKDVERAMIQKDQGGRPK